MLPAFSTVTQMNMLATNMYKVVQQIRYDVKMDATTANKSETTSERTVDGKILARASTNYNDVPDLWEHLSYILDMYARSFNNVPDTTEIYTRDSVRIISLVSRVIV